MEKKKIFKEKKKIDSESSESEHQKSNEKPQTIVKKRGRPKKTVSQTSIKSRSNKLLIHDYETMNGQSSVTLHIPLDDDTSSENSKNQFTMKDENEIRMDQNDNLVVYLTSDDEDVLCGSKKSLKRELRKRDEEIEKLKTKINDIYTKSEGKCKFSMTENVDKKEPLKCFNIKDGKCIIHKKTKMVCWWCTYPFDNLPCFIPEKYSDNKYYVFGNFCSYQCALAYIMKDDEYKLTTRRSLIKKLYKEIQDTNDNLLPADDREILDRFGGLKTIDEFRNHDAINEKTYKKKINEMVFYPMQFDEN